MPLPTTPAESPTPSQHFDGPCPFLMCFEEGPHSHPVCPVCGALRYGNIFCGECWTKPELDTEYRCIINPKITHIPLKAQKFTRTLRVTVPMIETFSDPPMPTKTKPIAILTIHNAAELHPKVRAELHDWLTKHANAVLGFGSNYAKRFRARYIPFVPKKRKKLAIK